LTQLRITFLGTGGSIPTATRSLPSIAVRRGGELLLFDCGEGTQRQMILSRIGFKPKTYIFLSHLHLDHISGLPGIIHTLCLLDRQEPLHVFGPPGTMRYVRHILEMAGHEPPFPIRVHEVGEGLIYRGKDYGVYAAPADHNVPCLAYAIIEDERPGKFYPEKARRLGVPEGPLWRLLQHGQSITLPSGRVVHPWEVCGPRRPGRKVVYSSDTRPTDSVIELAENADVLIHDATFDEDLLERAVEDGHSTAMQAAKVARLAGVRRLYLTHISARYRDASSLLRNARRIFPNTWVAEDLMTVEVPYPDASP